jgi:diguanylate cyclase (GGDEF)-like protein
MSPAAADDRPHPLADQPAVLLVEDSRTTQALLAKHLAAHYQTLEAHDGEEAWAVLQGGANIGLILTDVNMPRMNGQQLLAKIRKSDDPRIRSLPVIIMTAAEDAADRNLAFLNGANDYLSKPVDALELQARVNVHYTLARTIRELEESRRQLAALAATDPLTGLKNRRAFFERCREAVALAVRLRSDVSVLLLDVDHFKRINDEHGHPAGDQALIRLARLFERALRGDDAVARFGGEEFAVLLPQTNRLAAAVIAERMRKAVQEDGIETGGQRLSLTVSIGVASYSAEAVETIEELLEIADKRVYLAKKLGRNRICVTDDGRTTFSG